jgi:hypothetical protein
MFVFYTPFPDDKKIAEGGIDKRVQYQHFFLFPYIVRKAFEGVSCNLVSNVGCRGR